MRRTPTRKGICSSMASHCSFPVGRSSCGATDCSFSVCLRRVSRPALWSVFFENQRHFRAGGDAVPGRLLVFGFDLVLSQNRVAGLVDGKKVRVDGVALRVAHTFGLLQTNPHGPSSFGELRRALASRSGLCERLTMRLALRYRRPISMSDIKVSRPVKWRRCLADPDRVRECLELVRAGEFVLGCRAGNMDMHPDR